MYRQYCILKKVINSYYGYVPLPGLRGLLSRNEILYEMHGLGKFRDVHKRYIVGYVAAASPPYLDGAENKRAEATPTLCLWYRSL